MSTEESVEKNIWWNVNRYSIVITPVEVLGETAKFVRIMRYGSEQRCSKVGEYFPSFQEAKNHLLDYFATKKAQAEQSAQSYQKCLEKVATFTEGKS